MAAPPRPSRRDEVLGLLRGASAPLGAADIARELGVHVNTARFHLDTLVTDGAVVVGMEQPTGPGRPRATYRARRGPDRGGSRGFRLLAQILLSRLGSGAGDGTETARQAGVEWGRYLVERPAPYHRTGAGEAMTRLLGLLRDLDFDPQPTTDEEIPPSIRLRHCPFLELAEEYGSLVCTVHLGLTQGALEELRAPVETAAIRPFFDENGCLLDLREHAARP